MQSVLSDSLLSRLSSLLAVSAGLHFPESRWDDLERGLNAAAWDSGMTDVCSYASRLLSAALTRTQIERLASHLTVGETYFFRDETSFAALEEHILPELLHARQGGDRRLRIWSAGCSTGEEAYSIAILLDRLIPDQRGWHITILGTDINPLVLRKAAKGVYGEWSFRGGPGWVREKYFREMQAGRFEILPHIRGRVTFSYLNLADDVYPSLTNNTKAMDVILCRNVLMYFTEPQARQVAEKLGHALIDGGWLMVSATETSQTLVPRLKAVELHGRTFYRRIRSADFLVCTDEEAIPVSCTSAESVDLQDQNLSVPEPMTPAPATHVQLQVTESDDVNRRADDPAVMSRTARDYADRGRLDDAVAWCERAVAADKLNPQYHYLLGTIEQERGRHDAAARSLVRALYLDPDFVPAHFTLGNLRLSQDQQRDAERHFDIALALLRAQPRDEVLPESDGLTAGRLVEIIESVRANLQALSA